MMNRTSRCLIPVALLFASAFCQAQQSDLCQGDYYTEEQGAAKLEALAKRMNSVRDWQQHTDSLRAQLRKGMELEVLPARTPLNPRYRNK
ncbi:MAG TPA: hypothetical protein VF490_00730, partial [Chryseosolibacter sp.]